MICLNFATRLLYAVKVFEKKKVYFGFLDFFCKSY